MRLTLALLTAATALCSTATLADDCADEVKSLIGNAMTSGPMHMETSMTIAQGKMTMSGDIVPPGNMHTKVNTAGQSIELIILDGKAWMNVGGTWSAMPAAAAEQMAAGFIANATAAQIDLMTDMTCMGNTNVDGKDLLTYSYAVEQGGAAMSSRVYVDPALKAPVRIESDVAMGGQNTTMVVTYAYDPSIKITAPM